MRRAANLVSVYHKLCKDKSLPMVDRAYDLLPGGANKDNPANALDALFGEWTCSGRLKPIFQEVSDASKVSSIPDNHNVAGSSPGAGPGRQQLD